MPQSLVPALTPGQPVASEVSPSRTRLGSDGVQLRHKEPLIPLALWQHTSPMLRAPTSLCARTASHPRCCMGPSQGCKGECGTRLGSCLQGKMSEGINKTQTEGSVAALGFWRGEKRGRKPLLGEGAAGCWVSCPAHQDGTSARLGLLWPGTRAC